MKRLPFSQFCTLGNEGQLQRRESSQSFRLLKSKEKMNSKEGMAFLSAWTCFHSSLSLVLVSSVPLPLPSTCFHFQQRNVTLKREQQQQRSWSQSIYILGKSNRECEEHIAIWANWKWFGILSEHEHESTKSKKDTLTVPTSTLLCHAFWFDLIFLIFSRLGRRPTPIRQFDCHLECESPFSTPLVRGLNLIELNRGSLLNHDEIVITGIQARGKYDAWEKANIRTQSGFNIYISFWLRSLRCAELSLMLLRLWRSWPQVYCIIFRNAL